MVITITITDKDRWLIAYLESKGDAVGIHKKSTLIKKILWDSKKQEERQKSEA